MKEEETSIDEERQTPSGVGTGRVIQSGRVLDPNEPDNMSYLWHTHFFVSIPGNYILSASIIIIAYYFFDLF
jgi:hypothetical protein